MNHGNFVLEARPGWDDNHAEDTLILALTPGIPFEWIVAVTRMGAVRKSALRRMIDAATSEDHAKANDNASSITPQDAWRMLAITPAAYRGAIPLYAQLWLQASPETDGTIAKRLGLRRLRIWSWRNTVNFDPLTGVRI